MAEPPGTWGKLCGPSQQVEGPHQAAAGGGGQGMVGRQERGGLLELWEGPVIRNRLPQSSGGQGSIGAAEQQGAGGTVDGDRPRVGALGWGQPTDQVDHPLPPCRRILEPAGIGTAVLHQGSAPGIHQGKAETAAAEVDAEGVAVLPGGRHGFRRRFPPDRRWPGGGWWRSNPRSPRAGSDRCARSDRRQPRPDRSGRLAAGAGGAVRRFR